MLNLKFFTGRLFSFAKILILLLIILLTPKFFLLYSISKQNNLNTNQQQFKLGIENISEKLLKKLLDTQNQGANAPGIGLITNQTGIGQNGKRSLDILLDKGLNIKVIYVPEHGINGEIEAGNTIHNSIDQKTQIPIVSLYVGDSKFKKFNRSELKNIDLFIFDIQDSGTRHYTYITILYKMMEVAAEFNKRIIVLDRPNPLGIVMEGPLVDHNLSSFVSIAPIPLRHAMTVGELARYFNRCRLKKPAKLTIVPMKNYQRTVGLNNKLPIFLSPNIRNIDACYNYSFLGILDSLHPFDVLRNTEYAFQCLMLPESIKITNDQWNELIKILKTHNIYAHIFEYQKPNGQKFKGLKIKINNINDFSSFNTLLDVLDFFKDIGIKFSYAKIFNLLTGTKKVQDFINNKITKQNLAHNINDGLRNFYEEVKDLFIYQPNPTITFVN